MGTRLDSIVEASVRFATIIENKGPAVHKTEEATKALPKRKHSPSV